MAMQNYVAAFPLADDLSVAAIELTVSGQHGVLIEGRIQGMAFEEFQRSAQRGASKVALEIAHPPP